MHLPTRLSDKETAGCGGIGYGLLYDRSRPRTGDLTAAGRVPDTTLGTEWADTRLTGSKDMPITSLPLHDDGRSF